MIENFTDKSKWEERARNMKYNGPYSISSQKGLWQFVSDMGTSALWNDGSQTGYVYIRDLEAI